jgi:DNA-binding PadR family transcriptional regulator
LNHDCQRSRTFICRVRTTFCRANVDEEREAKKEQEITALGKETAREEVEEIQEAKEQGRKIQ